MSNVPEDVVRAVQGIHGCGRDEALAIVARDVEAVLATRPEGASAVARLDEVEEMRRALVSAGDDGTDVAAMTVDEVVAAHRAEFYVDEAGWA